MDRLSQQICENLKAEFRRRIFEESVPRIKQCLNELSEDEIWYKPNTNSNSVGNLVLHLCGNVKQYILSGIGSKKDERKQNLEFEELGPIPVAELTRDMDSLMEEVALVINGIKPEDLITAKAVQGFQEQVTSILVHVIEHFSYHTGQITYFTKYRKNMDTNYYRGLDLNATSN